MYTQKFQVAFVDPEIKVPHTLQAVLKDHSVFDMGISKCLKTGEALEAGL